MNLEKVSVQLAYLLRHCKEPVYISLEGGWVAVDTVLTVLRQRYPEVDRKTLDQIVAADKKGRYAYDPTGTYIRANQGHSIPGVQVKCWWKVRRNCFITVLHPDSCLKF